MEKADMRLNLFLPVWLSHGMKKPNKISVRKRRLRSDRAPAQTDQYIGCALNK